MREIDISVTEEPTKTLLWSTNEKWYSVEATMSYKWKIMYWYKKIEPRLDKEAQQLQIEQFKHSSKAKFAESIMWE